MRLRVVADIRCVARSATAKEIKHAYLKLAKTLHPDVTGNDEVRILLLLSVSKGSEFSWWGFVTTRKKQSSSST
jgi:curved DNA-binding protein CbpA